MGEHHYGLEACYLLGETVPLSSPKRTSKLTPQTQAPPAHLVAQWRSRRHLDESGPSGFCCHEELQDTPLWGAGALWDTPLWCLKPGCIGSKERNMSTFAIFVAHFRERGQPLAREQGRPHSHLFGTLPSRMILCGILHVKRHGWDVWRTNSSLAPGLELS